jgi:hypothetical protein
MRGVGYWDGRIGGRSVIKERVWLPGWSKGRGIGNLRQRLITGMDELAGVR